MLIRRYLFKEVSHTFLAVILVVLLIAICNKFVSLVGKAASGSIGPDVLFQLLLFQIPEMFAFLLPVGLFLAVLLSYGRFFADNEIPVMLACGISWKRLLMVSLSLAMIVMIFAGGLTCFLSPKLAQYKEQLLHKDGPMLLIQTVTPGRFHSFYQDRLVFYVADLADERSQLQHIFIAEHPKGNAQDEEWSLLTAKSGQVLTDQHTGYKYVKLSDGRRYNGVPGENDYTIVDFGSYQKLIEGSKTPEGLYFHRTMPTSMLLQNQSAGNLAELQWRLAIPLSAPLLTLLAVPLSRVTPRSGRFGRIFIAILILIVYFNLLTLCKRWVAKGLIPAAMGMWWVHALLLILGMLLLIQISGRGQQVRHWFSQLKGRHG